MTLAEKIFLVASLVSAGCSVGKLLGDYYFQVGIFEPRKKRHD
jgi:hypothetical protein